MRVSKFRLNAAVTPRIVIGGFEDGTVLLQIGGDKQRALGTTYPRHLAEQTRRLGRAKIADGRAGKENDAATDAAGNEGNSNG